MILNTQEALPRDYQITGQLSVHSVFLTIQGEGPFAGTRALFIRLYGCNLQCPLCDTEYTDNSEIYSPEELLQKAIQESPPHSLIVLTGGEPMRQNVTPFISLALTAGFKLQIETNGVLCANGLPWQDPNFSVVCSPKSNKVHPTVWNHATAFKYVAQAGHISPADGLPTTALAHPVKAGTALARPPQGMPVYLQPADEQELAANRNNREAVVDSCMKFGHRLCLQIHKIVEVE